MTIHFDQATDWVPDQAGSFEGTLDAGWAQGRAVFGGIQSAGAARLLQHLVDDDRSAAEVHTRYVAPLAPGPFRAEGTVLRAGGSVTQAQVRLSGPDGLATVVSAAFTRPRPSEVQLEPDGIAQLPPPERFQDLPHIPGVTPAFLQRVSLRWTEGGAPFMGAEEVRLAGLCRIPGTDLDALPVALALLDAYPTPALPVLTRPAAASTIAWTAQLYRLPDSGAGWWFFEEDGLAARHGAVTSIGRLYAPDGRLVATKTQLAAIYG